MSGRFTSSSVDSRRLTNPAHQLTRQSAGERRRIHGPVQPLRRRRRGPSPAQLRRMARLVLAWAALAGIGLAISAALDPTGASW